MLIHAAGLVSTSNDEGFGLPILINDFRLEMFENIEVFKEIYKDKLFEKMKQKV